MPSRKNKRSILIKRFFTLLCALLLAVTSVLPTVAYAEQPQYAEDIEGVSLSISFRDGANRNSNGDYVWTADSSSSGHAFIYRVTYAFSGERSVEAGSIQIKLPASILKNTSGNPQDTFDISVPLDTDPSLTNKNNWVYKLETVDGTPYVVVYNRFDIDAAEQGYFEISYITNRKTFYYPDYAPSVSAEDSLTGHAANASDPVPVVLYYNGVQKASDEGNPVCINTTAKISSTEKKYEKDYSDWVNSWGERPDDAGEYKYIIWRVKTVISNPTQFYTFSLVDSFDVTAGEVVGYKMNGQSTYTSAANGGGVLTGQSESYPYGRVDYVLTRYKKSEYQDLDYYKLINDVVATVTPEQGYDDPTTKTSSAPYIYEKHGFNTPHGWFYAWKFGFNSKNEYALSSDQILKYNLQEFAEGDIDTLDGLYYYTYVHGYPNAYTVEDGQSTFEVGNYWKVPVTFTLEDHDIWLKTLDMTDDQYEPLSSSDYTMTGLKLEVLEYDPGFDENLQQFVSAAVNYTETDIVYIYVQVNDDTDEAGNPVWHKAAEYNLYNIDDSFENDAYISSRSGKKYTFVNNASQIVTGFKIETTNTHYYTRLGAYLYLFLKDSSTVMDLAQSAMANDQHEIAIRNKSHSYVSRRGTEIISFDRYGYEYALGITREGEMKKSVVSYYNDNINKQYHVTWQLEACEKYKNASGNVAYVPQTSGIFYDLLPEGGLLDEDSIVVKVDGKKLNDGGYTVEVIANYNDTGRMLVIIRIDESAQKNYTVTLDSVHPWQTIGGYSENLINNALYETGNENIGNGETREDWIVPLDGITEAEPEQAKFMQHLAKHRISALTAASLGLFKKVWADGDSDWSFETNAAANGAYAYLVHFAVADGTSHAKNMIVFDSLENYIPDDDPDGGDWKGTLQSIDISVVQNMGCGAVVYYTESASFNPENLNENYDFSAHSDIWTEAGTYAASHADLSNVRGFAVDLRKGTDGTSEFSISPEDVILLTVYMKAPGTVPAEPQDPVVYNNIYLYSTVYDKLAPELSESALIWHDFTTVHLRTYGNIKIRKVDESDPETPIAGVKFQLKGTSRYGTEYDITLKTSSEGYVSFNKIEEGQYELVEVETTSDYILDPTPIIVTINQDGSVTVEGAQIDPQTGIITSPYEHLYAYENGAFIITNEPYIRGDVYFQKVGLMDGTTDTVILEGVTFRLTGTSNYGTEYLLEATSGADGIVAFEKLEWGTYKMVEIATHSGYILDNREYTVRIQSNGVGTISYIDNDGNEVFINQSSSGEYVVINEPYHHFNIYKSDEVNGNYLEGAVFTLTGTSDYGTVVNMTVTTAANGVAKFEQLEPGTYVLTEISSPENYILDPTPHVVVILSDGEVTIDGLEYVSAYKWYLFPNKRDLKGIVNIVKVWDDAGYEDQRTIPVVQIDTEEPPVEMPYVIIDKAKWVKAVCNGAQGTTNNLYNPVTSFVRSTETPPETATVIDDLSTDWRVKVWKDGNTMYWWSDAEVVYLPEDCSKLFMYANKLTTLDLSGFNTSRVKNMSQMFYECSSLQSINLSSFNTSKVTDMSFMFYRCIKITSLDLRMFDTSSLTNMESMFDMGDYPVTSALTSLIITSFDTSKVTSMKNLFCNCILLTSIDVAHFDTSAVTDMGLMFYRCRALTSLDVSRFDTSKVTNMWSMFWGCQALTSLDVSHFDTSKVTAMQYMFENCSSLTRLDVSHFNTSAVTDMENMFSNCSSLTSLDVSHFNTSAVTNMKYMFSGCSGLTSLDVSHFDTSKVTNMQYMFSDCSGLTSLDVSHFDTSACKSMAYMFKGCSGLTSLDVTSFNTSKVESMSSMFEGCSSLTTLNVTHMDTSKVESMHSMFRDCSSLTTLDVSRFNTSNNSAFAYMFQNCSLLTYLDVSHFDTSKASGFSYMFDGCTSLGNLDLSHFNTTKVKYTEYMFRNCDSMTVIDCSAFRYFPSTSGGSNLVEMKYMFYGCDNVTDIVLGVAESRAPICFDSLCESCKKLRNFTFYGLNESGNPTPLYVQGVLTANSYGSAYGFRNMFKNCSELRIVDFSTTEFIHIRYQYVCTLGMFQNCESIQIIAFPALKWQQPPVNPGQTTPINSGGKINVATSMFNGCTSLQKVYVDPENWGFGTGSSANMFKDCRAIVGQNGTIYNASKVNNAYAHVDVDDDPGYLWDIAELTTPPTTGAGHYYVAPTAPQDPLAPVVNAFTAPTENPPTAPSAPLEPTPVNTPSEPTGHIGNVESLYTTKSVMWNESYGDKNIAVDVWIDNNDNTWTYRMPVFDEDNTYYGWEQELTGYDTVYSLDGEDWQNILYIMLEYTGGNADTIMYVKNSKQVIPPEKSELVVTKTVKAGESSLGTVEITEEDLAVEFSFKVTLSEELTGTYGDMAFTDGVAEFTLKSGESARATLLPAGITYTVEETPVTNYEPVIPDNYTGELVAEESVTVEYVNLKTTPVPGKLTVKKTVVAGENASLTDDDLTKRFIFTITLTDDTDTQLIAPLISGTHIFGGLMFKDGVASITLAHNESYTVTGLPAGVSYTVTETPEDGFETEATGDTGVIAGGAESVAEFVNKKTDNRKYGSFTLKKVAEEADSDVKFNFSISFSSLEVGVEYTYGNSTFTAEEDGTATVELTLASDESVTFENLPVGSTYVITESESGYIASFEITEQNENGTIITVSAENSEDYKPLSTALESVEEDEEALIVYTNTVPKYEVPIIKVDETGDSVTGVVLQVLSGETVIAEWTTTVGSEILELPAGIYTLHEKEVPDGWAYADDLTFEVLEDGTISSGNETVSLISLLNKKTEITVNKVDENGETLAGAKLSILDKDGNTVITWTSTEEPKTVTGLLKAGEEYTLHEVSAPKGYEVADDVTFTISADGTVLDENGNELTEVIMNDPVELIEISVKKEWKDDNDKNGLRPDSIEVTLYADGEAYGEPVTLNDDNDWSYTWTGLLKYEDGELIEYTVEETEVPGYDSSVSDLTDGLITIINTPKKYDVTIIKVDEEGTALKGAELAILDESGNVIISWTTDGEPKVVTGKLVAGEEYTLHEVSAPKGYLVADDVKFTITADGTVLDENGNELTEVIMNDPIERMDLNVKKIWDDDDNKNGQRPDSIEVILYANGAAVGEPVTLNDENEWSYTWSGLVKYEDGKLIKYTVKEVNIPKGYRCTVKYDSTTGFVVTNSRIPDTGDLKNPMMWAFTMIYVIIALAAIVVVMKKKLLLTVVRY